VSIDDVIFAVWIVFWIYWIVASRSAKANESGSTRSGAIRILGVLVLFLFFRSGTFKHSGAIESPWMHVTGLVVFLAGLALAVWARVSIGRNWGTPMSRKTDPELVITGPYRRIRHPIYSGIILAMIGTTIAVSVYWLIAVVVLGGYFVHSALVEERTMTDLFPETYPQYKRSTKMLVPFVL
jgi:protein-S-isoprenylcysteine O-methyltransferase Ste14